MVTVWTAARDTFLWAPSPEALAQMADIPRIPPPPTSKHRLGVQSGVWSDFLSNSALTHPASHLAALGWSGFALRLWCATLNANLLKQRPDRGGRCEPHARPLPIPSTLFWFVVLCNRFSRVGGGGETTQEKISSCVFSVFYSHPSRKMSTITCWHIPQKHGLSVLHLSDKYPAYPWSLSTLVGNGRSGRKRLTCTCNNRAME